MKKANLYIAASVLIATVGLSVGLPFAWPTNPYGEINNTVSENKELDVYKVRKSDEYR